MSLNFYAGYRFVRPKDLIGLPIEIVLSKIAAKTIKVAGKIGKTGKEIHCLTVYYEDTDKGMGIIAVRADCGSYKPQSKFRVTTFTTDFKQITCNRCKKQEAL